jgi:hypothetical protein
MSTEICLCYTDTLVDVNCGICFIKCDKKKPDCPVHCFMICGECDPTCNSCKALGLELVDEGAGRLYITTNKSKKHYFLDELKQTPYIKNFY